MKVLLLFSVLLISAGVGLPAFAEPVVVEEKTLPHNNPHFVDEQIMIMSDISNNQDTPQSFAYLTQIKNNDGVVVSLSWLTGSLTPGQSFSPAQSWTPIESGTYHIQVFVWKSIDMPEALSPPLSMTVNVIERMS